VNKLLSTSALAIGISATAGGQQPLRYSVDLSDTVHHVFGVTLQLPALTAKNDVFEFAATAPGTYQTMDIGRFVHDFTALDAAGKPVPSSRIGANEWRLSQPQTVRQIRYGIIATRDTNVAENRVYPMCGTRLVSDYAMINGQGVFGFPRGMQAVPLTVKLDTPKGWTMGTSLRSKDGLLMADSYDQLVDSPILLGSHLTNATLDVTGVPVTIVVQSKRDQIQATQRYTFLYDFGAGSAGAWEHSYGSEYVLNESPFTPAVGAQVTDIAAHEFFHVVTPLNIHSEIIEHFNFATPIASQHLWLYEGTTEWAAHKMQLEAGLKSLPDYLATVVQKVRADRLGFDTTYSLTKLSLTSYSDSGQRQYGNIYQRGAIVAGLLDIKLLELSGGKRGLRELILDLSKQYGKHRAFPEAGLLDTIVARTSPEIGDFLNRYVRGAEHPPVKEYYEKLGITLIEDARGLPVRFELDAHPTAQQLKLRDAWMGKKARMA
jgi:predicted metalloprotease with PDZ domain